LQLLRMLPQLLDPIASHAAAGFPLTHPEVSRAFAVTSAHDPAAMDWQALAVSWLGLVPVGGIVGGAREQSRKDGLFEEGLWVGSGHRHWGHFL